jgi:hypothetical protein
MFAAYLVRGVKAGLVAGLVFGLFVALVANPLVAYADERAHGGHDHGDDAAVPTAVDRTVSVVAGGLWAVLLGGVFFGVVFYVLEPAIPGTGAVKSYVLAGAGFVTVSGAPWLVLPPVPPGVEESLPTSTRLALYGATMVAGALVCLLSGGVYARLRASTGPAVAAAGALVPFGPLALLALAAPTTAVQGTLAPTLRAGLVGLAVFGQVLVWLLLAAAHARLRPDGSGARHVAT